MTRENAALNSVKSFKIHFTNELNNPIHLQIKTGLSKPETVAIILTGPTSVSENFITEKEAKMILKLLEHIYG